MVREIPRPAGEARAFGMTSPDNEFGLSYRYRRRMPHVSRLLRDVGITGAVGRDCISTAILLIPLVKSL